MQLILIFIFSAFFLLSLSITFSRKSRKYESINSVLSLKGKLSWVWIDFFTKFPIDFEIYKILKSHNFKLCIVSPELQGHTNSKCLDLKNYIKSNAMYFDAVCTKKVNFWEE